MDWLQFRLAHGFLLLLAVELNFKRAINDRHLQKKAPSPQPLDSGLRSAHHFVPFDTASCVKSVLRWCPPYLVLVSQKHSG